MEKPHTGLVECPRILLSCFRARTSAANFPCFRGNGSVCGILGQKKSFHKLNTHVCARTFSQPEPQSVRRVRYGWFANSKAHQQASTMIFQVGVKFIEFFVYMYCDYCILWYVSCMKGKSITPYFKPYVKISDWCGTAFTKPNPSSVSKSARPSHHSQCIATIWRNGKRQQKTSLFLLPKVVEPRTPLKLHQC